VGDSLGATLRVSETTGEALTGAAITAGVGAVASTAVKGVVVATKTVNKFENAADVAKTASKTDGVASGGSGGGSVGSVSTTSTNAAVKVADEASGGSGRSGGVVTNAGALRLGATGADDAAGGALRFGAAGADDATKASAKAAKSEATKEKILSNIAESKNARESSNFKQYATKENALLDTTGKDSAKNVASYEKLKVDLKAREKTSANQVYSNMFNQDGTIKKEFLPKSDTQPIITGEALGNKALKEALIKDGSDIKDWGKYSLEGKNQELHYYYNRKTGEVFYDMDYKSKFKHIKGNK